MPTILKHFDIEQYFDVAVGSELEGGKRRHKDDVIEDVISQIGLRYGFAEADELENAGADYILENVEDILPFLNQM